MFVRNIIVRYGLVGMTRPDRFRECKLFLPNGVWNILPAYNADRHVTKYNSSISEIYAEVRALEKVGDRFFPVVGKNLITNLDQDLDLLFMVSGINTKLTMISLPATHSFTST